MDPGHPGGDGAAGHPVEAVAAGHPVALQHLLTALAPEADARGGGVHVLHGQHLAVEERRAAVGQGEGDEVLADLGLRVHRDGPAAGEAWEVDAVAAKAEPQLDAVVPQALAVQPLPGAGRAQHVRRALLQHPGPLPPLHVGAVAALQDDAVDPREAQQPGEQQTGRSRPDDPHGGTHRSSPFARGGTRVSGRTHPGVNGRTRSSGGRASITGDSEGRGRSGARSRT